jgi:hypothetical protein
MLWYCNSRANGLVDPFVTASFFVLGTFNPVDRVQKHWKKQEKQASPNL